jgi:hypothetical protein
MSRIFLAASFLCLAVMVLGCSGRKRQRAVDDKDFELYVQVDGQEHTLVATTEKNHDRLIELAVAKDNLGVGQMIVGGQVYRVANGTTVVRISKGSYHSEVRIMEGEHKGRSGWVTNEFVRREAKEKALPVSSRTDVPSRGAGDRVP